MGLTFTPVTGDELARLRGALLANGEGGAALHMDPRTTTFRPAPEADDGIDALIHTIRSVPCHYADPHEMRRIDGRVIAVYTDAEGNDYRIRDGEREYLNTPAGDEDRPDWCPLCGGNHAPDDGTPGYSCAIR